MPHLPSLLPAPPSHPTCLSLLQSCASIHHFLQIHAQMLRNNLFQDPFAAAKLVEFAATFPQGNLYYAHKLFSQIAHPTIFSWNILIRGFANCPSPTPSLLLFRHLLSSGSRPNSYTFPFLLKASTRLSALEVGEHLHGFMIKSGADLDIILINGLIYMYSTCRRIDLGHRVFNTSNELDIVSWNAMLSGYINCGLLNHAQHLFDKMPERGIVSWNVMINGYAKLGDIKTASELFNRMPERNVESWNTLIAGHVKCGQLDMARRLFDEMPIKNVVSWSAMITGYAHGDCPGEALVLFEKMKKLGVRPNLAAIVSMLSACSRLGALERGMQVHAYVERNKMKMDSIIGTALIDMYAKCGCIDKAFKVFDALVPKDVFSWTAMIAGLAVNGHGMKALELFAQMELDGVRPNEVTFVSVLCACSHGGMVDLAERYFCSMKAKYGLEPIIEHYGCMIDGLGRAGLLEEAVSLVQALPANAVLWGTLLGACWIHGNVEIAEYVIDRIIELKPEDGGVYVLLSNIYAMRGRWDEARRIRMQMKSKGLGKIPGCSSIEVHGIVHSFYVRDRSHPRTFDIYQMLDEIGVELTLAGYRPNTTPVSFDIEEHAVERMPRSCGIYSLLHTS